MVVDFACSCAATRALQVRWSLSQDLGLAYSFFGGSGGAVTYKPLFGQVYKKLRHSSFRTSRSGSFAEQTVATFMAGSVQTPRRAPPPVRAASQDGTPGQRFCGSHQYHMSDGQHFQGDCIGVIWDLYLRAL